MIKSRAELKLLISCFGGRDSEPAEDLLKGLDDAGLAVVPMEPTAEMVNRGSYDLEPGHIYRAMLVASPFRSKP